MNNKAISLSAFIIVFFVGLLVTYTNLLPIGGVGQAHAINAALSVTPQCSGGSSGFSITFTVPDSNGGNGNNANGRWRVAPQSSPSSPYDSGDLYPAGTYRHFPIYGILSLLCSLESRIQLLCRANLGSFGSNGMLLLLIVLPPPQ